MNELQQVRALMQQGRWQQARALCLGLDQQVQGSIEGLFLKGIIHGRLGEYQQSVQCLSQVVRQQPALVEAQNNLGLGLASLNQHEQALQAFQQAVELKPDFFEAWCNLGNLLYGLGRYEAALAALNRALDLDPHHAGIRARAGVIMIMLERFSEAADYFQRALQDKPDDREYLFYLAQCQHRLGHYQQAIDIITGLIEAEPDNPELHHGLGNVYKAAGQPEQALACYEQVLRLKPDYADVWYDQGVAYQNLGDLEQSNAAHRRAIACNPQQTQSYLSLANNRKFTDAADADLQAMEALLAVPSLPQKDCALLHFALAKAYEDLKDYARSFEHYGQANGLMRAGYDYSIAAERAGFQRLMQYFDQAFFAAQAGPADMAGQTEVPIFIVGMPRSGTTLTEQILASHPEVYGAGELSALSEILHSLPGFAELDYAAVMAGLDEAGRQQLADRYQQVARRLCTGQRFVVDKMPHNFLHVGFIRLLFPQAKVIHCQRDPVDTCLSCYKRYFTGSVKFAYDLTELGQHYCLYRELMAHWHRVLPGFVLDLRYEDLIADQEGQTRRLLEFCGLPWDEHCLSFYETRRSVMTNSYNQVRKPIYQSSVKSWKNFEPYLGPLLDALHQCDNGHIKYVS